MLNVRYSTIILKALKKQFCDDAVDVQLDDTDTGDCDFGVYKVY